MVDRDRALAGAKARVSEVVLAAWAATEPAEPVEA